ncbi:MAG TPA: response regulator [Thermomicrobiales bacterium]|jgi:DNA-binding NtrC family response regulator
MHSALCRGSDLGRADWTPRTAQPHVLVIDDDESLRVLYQEVIDEIGFRTTTWHRTVDTCDPIVALDPSLILLDLVFGGQVLGPRFLDQLKADPRTSAIPVVVATAAYHMVDAMASNLRRWNCSVLYKPFDLDDLVRVLRGSRP